MNTLRNNLKSEYSQIPNKLITDLNLCNGSLRVLLYLFTKPNDWNVYNADICKQLGISEQTLTKYWKKLLKSGWLKREASRDNGGRLTGGYDYLIGDFTVSIQSTESVKSIDYTNNKPINKEETTKAEINYEAILNVYNYYAEENNLTKLREITSRRKSKLITRFKENKNFNLILDEALKKISESSFLVGVNSKNWKVDFDWLIDNDTNAIKICEDKYQNNNNGEWK